MSDPQATDTVIHPLSASADGKRNMFSQRCKVVDQVMNYAACQWRLGVVTREDIKAPSDWDVCRQAAKCGNCPAKTMRDEELLKGHSIYFKERGVFARVAEAARTWLGPEWGKKRTPMPGIQPAGSNTARKSTVIAPHKAAPKPSRPTDALDAMGDLDGYAEAVNAAAAAHAAPATPEPAPAPEPVVRRTPDALIAANPMRPGESPRDYAVRLKTLREAISQPA